MLIEYTDNIVHDHPRRVRVSEYGLFLGSSHTNDIVVRATGVSSRHLKFSFAHEKLFVEDCGSTNGVFYKGRRLTTPLQISDKDIVYLGTLQLVFGRYDESSGETIIPMVIDEWQLMVKALEQRRSLDQQGISMRLAEYWKGKNSFPSATSSESELGDGSDKKGKEPVSPVTSSAFPKKFDQTEIFPSHIVTPECDLPLRPALPAKHSSEPTVSQTPLTKTDSQEYGRKDTPDIPVEFPRSLQEKDKENTSDEIHSLPEIAKDDSIDPDVAEPKVTATSDSVNSNIPSTTASADGEGLDAFSDVKHQSFAAPEAANNPQLPLLPLSKVNAESEKQNVPTVSSQNNTASIPAGKDVPLADSVDKVEPTTENSGESNSDNATSVTLETIMSPGATISEISNEQGKNWLQKLEANHMNLGKYHLIRRLGKGGMGVVYLAYHTVLNTYRALKILPDTFREEKPEFYERFLREARLTAGIRHPNLVESIDVDYDEKIGVSFLVMEYVDGGSLRRILKEKRILPIEIAVTITRHVALALDVAAENKIVHRDVKPDNIMFNRQGGIKLADLGIAKKEEDDQNLTRTDAMMGTPAYLSKEQVENPKNVDVRSDIYSLGVTLFEMLTGRHPYEGNSSFAIIQKLFSDPVPNPQTFNPAIPTPLSKIITRMLAKMPSGRYQNIPDFLHALDSCFKVVSEEKSQVMIKGLLGLSLTQEEEKIIAQGENCKNITKHKINYLLFLAILALVVLGGIVAFYFWKKMG